VAKAASVFGLALSLALLAGQTARAEPILPQLRIIAPAAPGGGWDQTARAMQIALQRAGIAGIAPVENIPGAAGTIGLARFMGAERSKGDAVLVSGLIMLGGIVTHLSPVTLGDVTPLARLTGEYEAVAVPASSPFASLDDLLRAFRERPESISWGGGSAGGSDQIVAGLIAQAVGVAPRRVNYIAFSGGGESLSAILGGQVSVGINGLAEFAPHVASGALRLLAISSAERIAGVDAPTLKEQGVDVVFENWRSLVAPPGISEPDRARLERAIAAMVQSPEWRAELARYRWIDRYLAGEGFARFTADEETRVQGILREFGVGRRDGGVLASGPYPLFVLGGLAMFAVVSVFGARRAPVAATSASRPECARPRASSIALISAGIALELLLAERAGFVIASAVLFWFTARAFDRTRPLRDAAFAMAISVAAYLLFVRVLQLSLPVGVVERWL
jgi:putative tricarboxylic transport membrane protein